MERRKFYTVICIAIFAVLSISNFCFAKYSGGDGTETNPYKIANPNDLIALGNNTEDYNADFIMVNDINLAGYMFDKAVIAPDTDNSSYFQGTVFTGTFDGNNHKINHFTISSGTRVCLGLFGCIGTGSSVKNLGLENFTVSGNKSVGGLCGSNGGSITNCYSTGNVSGNLYVGELCGSSGQGSISRCYSTGLVSCSAGSQYVGGLVGYNASESTISNCYSTCVVSGFQYVGGLVGHNRYGSIISNCYSTGAVSGSYSVGGLVGCDRNVSTIINCYSTGAVSTGGGLVGDIDSDCVVINSVWDVNTSGQTIIAGGEGKTTEQMQDINTFLTASWDFLGENTNGTCNYWQMPAGGGYPVLSVFNGSIYEPSGSGTENDPYIISDANGLGTVWYRPYAYYVLGNDIDLAGINWLVAVSQEFSGVFDGNNFCIRNLSINGVLNQLGLFGRINSGGLVKNLGIEDCNISSSSQCVGGLAGYSYGNVSNCYLTGVVSGTWNVGGLVGLAEQISISNCHSTGTVNGLYYVGGLVGYNHDSSTNHNISIVINCYSTSIVIGYEDVGGLCGTNSGKIANCYSTGNVTGTNSIGGLCGRSSEGNIANCYSSGNVSGTENTGGLCGYSDGLINNSYSTGDVNGISYTGGLCGLNGYFANINNCYSTGNVAGNENAGGLCGRNENGSITNCYSTGTVNGYNFTGGLCGTNEEGSIDGNIINSYSTGNVTGGGYCTGGLCGYNGGNVNNCYSTGLVNGDYTVGGLCGLNRNSVTNCYSTGNVGGWNDTGGLCGANDGSFNSSIANCYSTGNVTGNSHTGGLCGYNVNPEGSITDCYSTGTVSGNDAYTGGICGDNYYGNITNCYFLDTVGLDNGYGEPLTDEQMRQQVSFIDWDFPYTGGDSDDWFMAFDGYPILTWQISDADIYTDGENNFKDWTVFARYWMREDCRMYNDFCEFADMDFDGNVDIDDLAGFMSYWLEEGIY